MTKTAQTAPDKAGDVLERTLNTLDQRITALSKRKDAASVASQVKLVRLYLLLAGEKRKHEAHERRITGALSTELVVQWARGLEPAERAGLVRSLQQLDSKRSGLA